MIFLKSSIEKKSDYDIREQNMLFDFEKYSNCNDCKEVIHKFSY